MPIQTSFNAGEWSPLLDGQIYLDKRGSAVKLCQNLIALKQGPVVRRGGTKFIKEIKSSASRTALMRFEYSLEQAYQIEVGDQYFRFFRNNAVITLTAQDITGITNASPAVVTYSGSDTYANGNEVYITGVLGMTQINGRFFKVANVNSGANTFELTDVDGNNFDTTTYGTYTSAGTVAEVYEISTPFTQANLFDSNNILQLQHVQSADVLYIVHGSYAPRVVTRASHASWAINTLTLNDGPYLDVNTTATTLTLSGTTGSVTVTASAITGINGGTGFQETDIGRIIRWKDPAGNWTWLTITARTSTTVVTATISGADASAGTATANWRLGVYSDTTGWPRAIGFYQGDRLVMGGSEDYPDRFDMTKTGGYSDTEALFAPTNAAGTVADDNAITGTLQSGEVNAIQWMDSDLRGLVIGTAKQEFLVTPSTLGEFITPTNKKSDAFYTTGSAYIKPVRAGAGLTFVQRARRRLHDINYSFEQDTLKPRDLTLAAEHITRTQIIGIAYQQEPVNVIWGVRNDGLLIGMTYYPDQEVFGWHRHPVGGVSDAAGAAAIVESISVIPSSDGSRDELWLIVKRYINGATRRYIEYMTRYYEDDMDQEDAFHVDCGLTYDSTATNVITGMDHLEGQTVKLMVDGRSHTDKRVIAGSVTLSNDITGSTIHIGLANTWALQTLQIEAGTTDRDTAQGKVKRITNVVIRLLNTLGLKYGPNASSLDEYDFSQGSALDAMTPLFSGDTKELPWPEGYETAGHLYLTHDGVFPACITAIMPDVRTYS